MRKKNKRIVSLFTAFALTLATAAPALASGEVESETYSTAGTQSTEVTTTIADTFSVIIPKKVTLDGSVAKPEQTFNVTVKGDAAANRSVVVTSDPSFTLTQTGKASVSVNAGYSHTWRGTDIYNFRRGAI